MSLRRSLSAGFVDAALASLATFVMGLFVIRVYDPVSLGAYALFFTAFRLVAVIPAQFVFAPAEVAAVELDPADRLLQLRHSAVLGTGVATVSSVLVFATVLVVPGGADDSLLVALAVTTTTATFLSPIQDHVRRMLHIGARSWAAAIVSGVQLVSFVAALGGFVLLDVARGWVPFGALTLANAVSLAVALALALAGTSGRPAPRLELARLYRSGRWLLLVGVLLNGAELAANAIASAIAGLEVAGYAEAARTLGRPVAVLAMGLTAVLGPRSAAAAVGRDRAAAARIRRLYQLVLVAAAVPYLLLLGFPWSWNPLTGFLPNAYAVAGLAAVTVVSHTVWGTTMPVRFELMGARREPSLAVGEVVASAAQVVVALTAGTFGAFAIAGGYLLTQGIRGLSFRVAMRGAYDDPEPADPLTVGRERPSM